MLNIPISVVLKLKDSQNILLAGCNGQDVLTALPLYFSLKKLGKNVHLSNYSTTDFSTIRNHANPLIVNNIVLGAIHEILNDSENYLEGYLSRWFYKSFQGQQIPIWFFAKVGSKPLTESYNRLIEHLQIDAIVLCDSGTTSLLTGEEEGAEIMLENTIHLSALSKLDVPVKLLVNAGFGSEMDKGILGYNILQNIANLNSQGGFYGSASLLSYMECFRHYKSACQYVWDHGQTKSQSNTMIISAAEGVFGDIHLYPEMQTSEILVSPLVNNYWFFELDAVSYNNQILPYVEEPATYYDCVQEAVPQIRARIKRPTKIIPY